MKQKQFKFLQQKFKVKKDFMKTTGGVSAWEKLGLRNVYLM
jgi:hypothetical protein